MTKHEIKAAIRRGDLTPGVTNELFQEAHREVIAEDHPGWSITTLVESRGGNFERDGVLPAGIHARVAALIESASDQTPRSDLKSDSVFDRPRQSEYAPDFGAALRAAVAGYLEHPLPAPKKRAPVMTLSESRSLADFRRRFPDATDADYAYALLTDRL